VIYANDLRERFATNDLQRTICANDLQRTICNERFATNDLRERFARTIYANDWGTMFGGPTTGAGGKITEG
jgi:hypothetical protein